VFVSCAEGGTYLKGIREWDAKEDFLGGGGAIEAVNKQRLRKLRNCLMKSFMICTSPNIIRVIKSRRMTCVERLVRMGENRRAQFILVGKP